MADTPTTEIGRDVWLEVSDLVCSEWGTSEASEDAIRAEFAAKIAAVEAEAVAAERARIRAAVEALHPALFSRRAVLAILDPESVADPGDHHVGVGGGSVVPQAVIPAIERHLRDEP